MKKRESWAFEIGFVLFFGVPIYWSAYFTIGLQMGLLVHVVLVVIYTALLRLFGRGSVIDMGVAVTIIAVLAAILFPALQRTELKNQRLQQRQSAAPLHHCDYTDTTKLAADS